MENKELKYTVCTEGSDYNFPYLRVMLLSLLKHNLWAGDGITILTCNETPLSEHNRAVLNSICGNITYRDIDPKTYQNIKIKESEKRDILPLLYKIEAFNLVENDAVIYISSFSLCISNLDFIFKSNSSIVVADTGHAARSTKNPNQMVTVSEFNTSIMLISKEVLAKSISSKIIGRLSNTRNINPILLDSKIHDSLLLEEIDIGYLPLNRIIKKSKFTDSKFSKFLAVKKNISLISLDIGVNQRVKSQAAFMYKKMDSLWQSYNQQGEWYTESRNQRLAKDHVSSYLERRRQKNNKKTVVKNVSRVKKSEYAIDHNKLSVSNKEFNILIENNASNSAINNLYETAVVIAFKNRHSMVELNVSCLSKQTLTPAIILVVSNLSDYNFARDLKSKYSNVFICLHENYPMGAKWNAGVKYAQKLKVKGLMILGSDDLISLDYIKHCYEAIDQGNGSNGKGVDLIGNRSWYIYDTAHTLYHLSYTKNVKILLGGGKMFSKNFLDSVDWNIFISSRHKHLDARGYELVEKFSNSISVIEPAHFILSIKGKWEVINSSQAIRKAKNRITHKNVSNRTSEIFKSMQIENINEYVE